LPALLHELQRCLVADDSPAAGVPEEVNLDGMKPTSDRRCAIDHIQARVGAQQRLMDAVFRIKRLSRW
jgi:hypothetical protein